MSEGLRKILLILRIVMPILFILIGVYCLALPEKIQLQPQYTKMFAWLVIIYGIFRLYRAVKVIQEENSSKNSEE